MKQLGANIRIVSKLGKTRIEQTVDYIEVKISAPKIKLNGQDIQQ